MAGACALAACHNSTYYQTLKDGFPSGVGFGGDEEANMRFFLERYHVHPADRRHQRQRQNG